ncbi:hypothetical protein C1E23_14550 [Pseudoalteromonas phenolica]|uniref:Uncharacterized protein n=1 Tax=Pseudoalteromonas phenolica TaxID=161398 RepID=A0A4Q7IM07_9GAMM|nr:hypothetical protein [Pseudoalteromonas phenolica]RZQ52366.1 hypothetical protein C1E23_14550 [Pseudoalteromonas phenolica]
MTDSVDTALLEILKLKKQRRKVVKRISNNIAYKPTFEADYYREALFYRFLELTESTHALYKSNLLVAAITTARSAHETLAVMWYHNSKLTHLIENKDLEHFSESMKRLLFGWSKTEEFPEKINVLTCIKSVDKKLEGSFGDFYDMLSEYALPNYSGALGVYSEPNFKTYEVLFGEYPRSKETLKKHIEDSIVLGVNFFEVIQSDYEKLFTEALEVCVELHKEGKLEINLMQK